MLEIANNLRIIIMVKMIGSFRFKAKMMTNLTENLGQLREMKN